MMKELSIEEKANAYDKVRNKIAARFGTNVAQEIFSEYEESEDEKIRKELINFLQLPHPKFVGERKQEKWLVWLEKQGEKTKPIEGFDTEFERQISHLIASAIDREHEYNEGYVKWTANALLEYAKRELEKQGEKKCIDDLTQQEAMDIAVAKCFEQGGQKPVDKVEPKFNIGDWVIRNIKNEKRIGTVTEILPEHYIINFDGWREQIPIINGDCIDIRLWTLQDAKPGDVLAFDDNNIVMFKDLYNATTFHSYCHIEDGLFDVNKDEMPDWWEGKGFHPATKEQRDMLFQRMHEAGYTFDFEKKELKKIEPLTDFEKAFQGMCCEKNKQFVKECCKTLIELAKKQLQPKRNELELDETSYKVGVSRVLENPESYGLTKNHLKPSSSDIEALEDIVNGNSNPTAYLVLQSIIEQLKNT